MKQERNIERMAGRRTPYRVPEGYFDNFQSRMMDALPERSANTFEIHRSPRRNVWHMVIGAAACLCIAIGGVAVYMSAIEADSIQEQQLGAVMGVEQYTTSSYEEDITDLTMMDNMQIYAYLAGE